jgi:fatty acid-binding protein DegV
VAIVHARDQETAELLQKMLDSAANIIETVYTELSISVAANLGPKTVGVVAMPEDI